MIRLAISLGALVLLACGGEQKPIETIGSEALDGPAKASEPTTTAATEDVALPELAKLESGDIGTPPPSSPTGEPQTFSIKPATVGAVRVRSVVSEDFYGIRADGHRQRTAQQFQLREEVTKVSDGIIAELRVKVLVAREVVEIEKERIPATLLMGEYLVARGDRGVAVRRGGGTEVYGREQEELSGLLAGVFDKPLLNQLLASKSLRVGETVELTAQDTVALGGAAPAPVFLTLLDRSDGLLRYQLNMKASLAEGLFTELRSRVTLVMDASTGAIREAVVAGHKTERRADLYQNQNHSRTVITPVGR